MSVGGELRGKNISAGASEPKATQKHFPSFAKFAQMIVAVGFLLSTCSIFCVSVFKAVIFLHYLIIYLFICSFEYV